MIKKFVLVLFILTGFSLIKASAPGSSTPPGQSLSLPVHLTTALNIEKKHGQERKQEARQDAHAQQQQGSQQTRRLFERDKKD